MKHHLEKHAELYHTSAYFRQAVDTIVPLLLDTLATKAREFDDDQAERLRMIMGDGAYMSLEEAAWRERRNDG